MSITPTALDPKTPPRPKKHSRMYPRVPVTTGAGITSNMVKVVVFCLGEAMQQQRLFDAGVMELAAVRDGQPKRSNARINYLQT